MKLKWCFLSFDCFLFCVCVFFCLLFYCVAFSTLIWRCGWESIIFTPETLHLLANYTKFLFCISALFVVRGFFLSTNACEHSENNFYKYCSQQKANSWTYSVTYSSRTSKSQMQAKTPKIVGKKVEVMAGIKRKRQYNMANSMDSSERDK